jgi:hypothetical chaperone protein
MLGIGIDFGTSNSSVALFDGQKLAGVRLEPETDAPEVMPSALYLDRELRAEIGRAAIETYLLENAGRTVVLQAEDIGEITFTVSEGDSIRGSEGGSITTTARVHAFTDREQPGRMFRGVKRWLGNSALERVQVFDARYRIVALVTPVLKHLAERATDAAGGAAPRVYVGRPVHFEGGSAQADATASARLAEACGYAGLDDATLYPEPVAAALSFLHARGAEPGSVVLAFDFGGGTLDLTLLRNSASSFEILATHGVPIGGDEINRRVYRDAVFPALGEGAQVWDAFHTRKLPFDFRAFSDRLLNWPLAYELNTSANRELIRISMQAGGDAAIALRRLLSLIDGNHAYRVFQAIERAKLSLSLSEDTSIQVPELALELPLSRERFERIIEGVLSEIDEGVQRTLTLAGLEPSQIDVVVRTGGSSQIPAVVRLLERHFGDRVVEHGVFTSIAAGLAIAAFHEYDSVL